MTTPDLTASPSTIASLAFGDVSITADGPDTCTVRGEGLTVNRVTVDVTLHLYREGSPGSDQHYGPARNGWVVKHPYFRRTGRSWPESEEVSWNARDKITDAVCAVVSEVMERDGEMVQEAERASLYRSINSAQQEVAKLDAQMAEQQHIITTAVARLAELPEDTRVPAARVLHEVD